MVRTASQPEQKSPGKSQLLRNILLGFWLLWTVRLVMTGADALAVPGWFLGRVTAPPDALPPYDMPLAVPSIAGMARALLKHLQLLGAFFLLAWISARAGTRALAVAIPARMGQWERLFLGAGLGWAGIGMALYGLALTGLFTAPAAAAILAAAAASGARLPRPGFRAALVPAGTAAALSAPIIIVAPLFMVPNSYIDTYLYHLGLPDQFLKSHRFVVDWTSQAFQIPVLGEFLNVYAILLGHDAFAHLAPLVPYLAGIGLAAAWTARMSGRGAAGVAAGLALTAQSVVCLILAGKNDLAEVGYCLMAMALTARGFTRHAAVMWGVACGVKMNGYAFAGMAWVAHEAFRAWDRRRSWRPDPAWPLLVFAGAAPWLAKSWLLKGDPVWPFLSRWIPGALWDPVREEALKLGARVAPSLSGIFSQTASVVLDNQPAVAVMAPAFVLAFFLSPRSVRRGGLFVVGAHLAYMALIRFEYDRLSLPLLTFFCFAGACAGSSLLHTASRGLKAAVALTLVVSAWMPVARGLRLSTASPAANVNYLLGNVRYGRYVDLRNTTYGEVQAALARLEGVRYAALVCEGRCYRWPCRIRTDDMLGRNMPWALTREADTPERLGKRFRQLGVSHLVFNFITESYTWPCDKPYAWDSRQLDLWHAFVKGRLVPVTAPFRSDHQNGGFYIFRLAERAKWPAPGAFYMPGIKPLRWEMQNSTQVMGSGTDPRGVAMMYAKRFPDIGIFNVEVSMLSVALGDWKTAYEAMRPWYRAGLVSDVSTGCYGQACLALGRYDEAVEALGKSTRLFIDQRQVSRTLLGKSLAGQAWKRMDSGNLPGAHASAFRAYGTNPPDPVTRAAYGTALAVLGRCREAAPMLAGALAQGLDPESGARASRAARRCGR
jgi:hypothetical protein